MEGWVSDGADCLPPRPPASPLTHRQDRARWATAPSLQKGWGSERKQLLRTRARRGPSAGHLLPTHPACWEGLSHPSSPLQGSSLPDAPAAPLLPQEDAPLLVSFQRISALTSRNSSPCLAKASQSPALGLPSLQGSPHFNLSGPISGCSAPRRSLLSPRGPSAPGPRWPFLLSPAGHRPRQGSPRPGRALTSSLSSGPGALLSLSSRGAWLFETPALAAPPV